MLSPTSHRKLSFRAHEHWHLLMSSSALASTSSHTTYEHFNQHNAARSSPSATAEIQHEDDQTLVMSPYNSQYRALDADGCSCR